ncbi:MAG: glycosyltransferase family 39 protein [Beijerinckiaceae bacterium]
MRALARASASLLFFAARSHTRAAALLLAFGLLAFSPGLLTMQPMDRDEPRFAQATKQMLETGDYVDIRFQNEARHKKPVGIYWIQAVSVSIGEARGVSEARRQIWLYRLPSLLGALASVLLAYWASLALLPRRDAVAAALIFGATILIGVEARIAKTDAVMCATAVVAFGILARLWVLRRTASITTGEMFALWAAIGLSVLLKGPVIGGVFAIAATILSIRERSVQWLRPIADWRGAILALLIVLPWFATITLKTGGAFFAEAVRNDMLGKVAGGQEMHGAPPGLYFLIFPLTFWPASALLCLAVPYAWRNRTDDVVSACLAWAAPAWIMFELIPTKLPHYVLPLFPALAILTAKAAAEGGVFVRRGWRAVALALTPVIPIGFAALAVFATATLEPGGVQRFLPLVWAAPLFVLAILFAFAIVQIVRANRAALAAPIIAAATLALSWSVYQFAWPALRSIQLSPLLAAATKASGCADPLVATVGGYNEPSLVFLTRTDLAMLDAGADAADFMAGDGCRIALVDVRAEPAFVEQAKRRGLTPRLLTRIEGVNINRAFERNSLTLRRMDIGVYLRDTSRP